ncbi:TIGR03619 family F420-dependent LLM class oxidoreductase [Nocardioides humi]|uniref:LLM class F420-dependent oxidoreductase n=1 Tax=Nocardioides humi TaxID=449461 RepID=A0ABN2BKS3_9ACTN|nr:TIGR03619 family F420-dependent LLM class oxidoreductase [Nocardioides humi]
MRVVLLHPLAEPACAPGLSDAAGTLAVARAAQTAGFDAIGFADHPAPSRQWVDHGGHGAFDPLTALAFVAGVTDRIHLLTYLAVLPYRSPWLTLKQATTVDRLSDGRLSMTVGAGYLRSEFSVLGKDFARRNEDVDACLSLLRSAWGAHDHPVVNDGYHGTVVLDPDPVQDRLPLLIGGNSAASRRRAATVGDGWSPMIYDASWSAGNRTAPLSDLAGLAAGVADLHARSEEAGREPSSLTVQVDVPGDARLALDAPLEQHVDALAALSEAGATTAVLRPPASSLTACLEAVQRWGEEVRGLAAEV